MLLSHPIDDKVRYIASIKGIGEKGGAILLSVIGDIENYEDEKKLHAYFGIVPRISQSGDMVHYGKITKAGSKLGRTTLVQCTLIAIRYSPYLRSFYTRLKAKKGRKWKSHHRHFKKNVDYHLQYIEK